MADQKGAHAVRDNQNQGTSGQKQQRKKRILNKDRSALVRSIAQAVVIKDQDLFFLCERDGRVPAGGKHGFGLYYHDCRFLNGYEVGLADSRPSPLAATARKGFQAELELTNPDIRTDDGQLIQKEDIAVRWERVIDAAQTALYDQFGFTNHKLEPVHFPFSLRFGSAFEDLFTVRGMPTRQRGKLHAPKWQDGVLTFVYDGTDKIRRSLAVHLFPAPAETEGTTAHFQVRLDARANQDIRVALVLAETPLDRDATPPKRPTPDVAKVAGRLHDAADRWLEGQTQVHSDSVPLNRALERSLRDLRVLRSELKGLRYFAAGVPWYVTLFGRDSLISSLQTLAYEPEVAAHTLRLLASYQGTKEDAWRDEEPGKIMHELRVGELAHDNEIPQTPYYGTIDATPLFLILLCRHAAWTGRLDLFHELRGNVERALEWMAKYGDPTGDGFLAYQVKSKKGLGNQGWKHSGDSIVNADGSLAKPPIALAEVQGYAYLARAGLADLYRRAGEQARADRLRREADDLRKRFNEDFWLEDLGIYALALQDGGKPCAVVASNAGQALWSGIAEPERARKTMERLTADDVFSGWGIRTLSARERRYNPIGYHLGTVWPHDNSIIAAGFRLYGFDQAAARVFAGILDAATHFHSYRLPEVFAGFRKDDFGVPVHYPVACHPQAWAAGSLPFLLQTLLGLVPEGFAKRLRVVRPVLPDGINRVELRRLRVGDARVDLRFHRAAGGALGVEVLRTDGTLEVAVEPKNPG